MAEQSLIRTNFSGGVTTIGEKIGEENSARFIKRLNIFESPDYVTLSRLIGKVSGSEVDGSVLWIVDGSPWSTNRYFYDDQGKIYQETSGGTWSTLRTVSGGAGEGLIVFDNALYYAQGTDWGRYHPLDNSPSFTDAFSSWWNVADIQETAGDTGATDYTPQTSIDEGATHRQTFTADHDPIKSITIDVDVVGTGDWTITVHDAGNNLLGSVTITNGSMSTGDATFTFSSPVRVTPTNEYHFHVTSTVADGGVDTGTNNDLEDAEYTIEYSPLIDTDYHPMVQHVAGIVIGNERHLAFFDQDVYNPTAVTLDAGFKVRTLIQFDEYVVAGAWKGQSFEEAEEARLYFWDGIEPTYNYSTPVDIGVMHAMVNYKNNLVGVYGNRGSMFTGNSPFQEIVDEIPKLDRGKRVEVFPGAISTYNGRVVVGYAGDTDSSQLVQGVYEYGSQTDALTPGLALSWPISTGTETGTTLKITAVKSFGEDLYVAWRDGDDYGVDDITITQAIANTASFEERIFDAGDPDRYKQAIKIEVTFESLPSGATVTPKYRIDRASNFTTGGAVSTSGETRAILYIHKPFKEIEWGFDLTRGVTATIFPKITSLAFIYDPLPDEADSA